MKRYVNGDEVELDPAAADVVRAGDRLMVRSSAGTYSAVAVRQGDAVIVSYQGRQYRVERRASRATGPSAAANGELRAPMPGQIVDVRVEDGAAVKAGDVILVLEAMKTQQPFAAPFDGTVAELKVAVGEQVADGQLLARVEKIER